MFALGWRAVNARRTIIETKRKKSRAQGLLAARQIFRNGKVENGKLNLALFNNSKERMRFGELSSGLGCDQFRIEFRAAEQVISFQRKPFLISPDTLTPVEILPGSFAHFQIDFLDGTWHTKDIGKPTHFRIVYDPAFCSSIDIRQKKKIYNGAFASKWIEFQREPEK